MSNFNIINTDPAQESEENANEAAAKAKFARQWKILLAVFIAVCIGIVVYFAFFREEKHVKLGQYKGLTYTQKDVSVSDAEVQEEKERLINSRTSYEKLEDRNGTPSQKGDIVNCTYKGQADGKMLEEGSGNFELGSGKFKEFEDSITGRNIGETVDITVVIPNDYSGTGALSEYKGKEVSFEVKLNYVSQKTVPEVTDGFVTDVTGGKCSSAEEFEAFLKKEIQDEKQAEADSEKVQELIDQIIADSEFIDIDGMVKEYYDTMYDTYMSAAKRYELGMDEYIKQFYSMELADFQAQLKDTMTDLVKEQLVLKAIAEKEDLKLDSERYNTYLERYMEDYGYSSKDDFIDYYGEDAIRESMLYDYAIDFVIENAKPKS